MKYLYPTQREAALVIIRDLSERSYSVIKGAAATGKSTIVGKVVDHSPRYTQISIMAPFYEAANREIISWSRKPVVQINKWPDPKCGEAGLIVIPDAFATPNSYAFYLLARHRGHHVIAYGTAPQLTIGDDGDKEWDRLDSLFLHELVSDMTDDEI